MKTLTTIFAGFAIISFVACKEDHATPRATPDETPARKAPMDSAHANVNAGQKDAPAAALDPKRVDSPAGIQFDIPNGWKRLQPKSTMRIAELTVPRSTGDASDPTITVFFFGGNAGNFDANVTRWLSQVATADGKPLAIEQAKIGEIKGATRTFKTFEAEGNITETNPQMQVTGKINNGILINATAENAAGAFFFRFAGPAKSVAAARADFENMLKSVTIKD
ncbi:MAG: hypothetical protein HY286_19240 [Planctomycetes bacterium]|nr:hypothetical protein [Planctomycetota bacterium]